MKILLLLLLSLNVFAGSSSIPDKDANGKLIQHTDAFARKSSYNFYGQGKSCAVTASVMTVCEYAIPIAHVKFNGVAILNTAFGDKANLKIVDTATGSYSGTANYLLNQFGFDWYMHSSKTIELLPYPADLYQGMRIVVEYTNGPVAKTIYVNYYLHKE